MVLLNNFKVLAIAMDTQLIIAIKLASSPGLLMGGRPGIHYIRMCQPPHAEK
jgi:hypothetical protein